MTDKKKKCRKKLGKYSRDKGKRFERLIANMLKARYFPARRGIQYKGGINSPDVICEALEWMNFECKAVEALNLGGAMKQSIKDSKGKKVPLVIHKKARTEVLVTMRFTDWIDLVQWAVNDLDEYNQLEIDREKVKHDRYAKEKEEISLL